MNSAFWSTISAVVSAIAAAIAAYIAKRSKDAGDRAAIAGERAAHAAQQLTDIERQRDWSDRIPQFKLTLREVSDLYAELVIELTGPPMLDRLDEISLSVRNDYFDRGASPVAQGPSRDEVRAFVWGPFRFRPGVDGGTPDGRAVEPFPLPLGEWTRKAMDRQSPPPWATHLSTEDWQAQYKNAPVRLMVECKREGFPRWTVPLEVLLTPIPKTS